VIGSSTCPEDAAGQHVTGATRVHLAVINRCAVATTRASSLPLARTTL
jgi:hypothetical protein